MTSTELIEIEEGYVMEIFTMVITNEIRLKVYDNVDATLIIGDKNEVNFDWSDEAKRLFNDIDVAEPIELLTILSQCSSNC